MSIESEVQCRFPEATMDDPIREFHNASKVTYARDFLLSFADLNTSKSLPSGFDSSILWELKDTSAGLLQPFSDSDAGQRGWNVSQHVWQNPETGILGKGALLREPRYVAGATFPQVQGMVYQLLNRSVAPYRPPRLNKMNSQSGRERKNCASTECASPESSEQERSRRDSIELITKEEQAKKEMHIQQKENLDSEVSKILEDSRDDERLINKCDQSEEVVSSTSNNSRHCSSAPIPSFKNSLPPGFTSKSHKKNFETKPINHSLIPEHSNVKVVEIESPALSFSESLHKFNEEEKKQVEDKITGDIKGESELPIVSNRKTDKLEFRRLSSGRNRVSDKHMASTFPPAADEISESSCSYKSIQSEVNKNDLPQLHWEQSYDIEAKQPNPAKQHLLTMLKKSTDVMDPAAAHWKLNMPTRNAINLASDMNWEPSSGTIFTEELHSADISLGQKVSADRAPDYHLGDSGTSYQPNDNKDTKKVHECIGVIGDGVMYSERAKNAGLNKIKDDKLASDDVDATIQMDLGSAQELELDPGSGFCEEAGSVDDICWPDEDSLITPEDFIYPRELMSTPAEKLIEADPFTTKQSVNITEQQLPSEIGIGNERSLYNTKVHSSLLDDVMNVENSSDNLFGWMSYPQIHHSQTIPRSALNPSLKSKKACRSFKLKTIDSQNYNPPPLHSFSSNVLPDLLLGGPYNGSTRFDSSLMLPSFQQMPIPGGAPRCGPPGTALSHHSIGEVTGYSHGLNEVQNLPLNHWQQNHNAFELPILGRNVAGNCNQSPFNDRSAEMELITKRIHQGWPWKGNI